MTENGSGFNNTSRSTEAGGGEKFKNSNTFHVVFALKGLKRVQNCIIVVMMSWKIPLVGR
jgi:hypothetical protein